MFREYIFKGTIMKILVSKSQVRLEICDKYETANHFTIFSHSSNCSFIHVIKHVVLCAEIVQ